MLKRAGKIATAVLLLQASTATAYEAGDWILRAGAAGFFVAGESEVITALAPDAKMQGEDAFSLGLTATYMVSKSIGVGLFASWPFEHDIRATHEITTWGHPASIRQVSPTLTLQYHLDTASRFKPYIGIGVNYTYFFAGDTSGPLAPLDFVIDDSWGLAGEVGLDVDLGNDWLISGQVWYVNLETIARLQGVTSFDIAFNPWVAMIGIGKKF